MQSSQQVSYLNFYVFDPCIPGAYLQCLSGVQKVPSGYLFATFRMAILRLAIVTRTE